MKLDRNLSGDGRGKYGLILNRELAQRAAEAVVGAKPGNQVTESQLEAMKIVNAVSFLEAMGIIDWGTTPETEFFVMRLKDEHAGAALAAYATDAKAHGDPEYANQIYYGLATRAGRLHPHSKKPD
ncbi:hypothetical protein [Bradyrhizobium embrapense]|uniref:hypothetical protein n=1 Tax=Bradyrhizobium embrapense TaxID=630921 RepID=UPI00067DB000|nr:hypothetical protein [Bradyrhizobium embrapense]